MAEYTIKMEAMEEDMGQVVPRALPAGAPADADPITEDQIERLPEYVQTAIQDFMDGKMAAATSREDLERLRAAFFAAAPPAREAEAAAASTSNSMNCEEGVDEESMRID